MIEFAYLILMAIFIGLPTLYLWKKNYSFLTRQKRVFFTIILIALVVGYAWDYLAIRDRIWFFPNILGVWILGLPIEEWVFIVAWTLWTVTLVFCMAEREKI